MKKETIKNLDNVLDEFSMFLNKDFSSRFKTLSDKEDRQLFFLAKLLTKMKHVSEELKKEEKVLVFPSLQRIK